MGLPASAIDLHLQSADIDFIAAKKRSAIASGNGARTGIDQIVASTLERIVASVRKMG
jgi:hypothetical protein